MRKFNVGDKVIAHDPGSWVDGKEFTIERLNVTSSDGIHGHKLKYDGEPYGCVTVVGPSQLTKSGDVEAGVAPVTRLPSGQA